MNLQEVEAKAIELAGKQKTIAGKKQSAKVRLDAAKRRREMAHAKMTEAQVAEALGKPDKELANLTEAYRLADEEATETEQALTVMGLAAAALISEEEGLQAARQDVYQRRATAWGEKLHKLRKKAAQAAAEALVAHERSDSAGSSVDRLEMAQQVTFGNDFSMVGSIQDFRDRFNKHLIEARAKADRTESKW